MSYKSPIELVIGQFRMEQEKRIEGEVFKAIQDYGINIDKDELIRALQYDRGQYDKGYEDGYRDGASEVAAKIFAEIEMFVSTVSYPVIATLKKKYTEENE